MDENCICKDITMMSKEVYILNLFNQCYLEYNLMIEYEGWNVDGQ